jgi:hypothetical protein
MQRDRGISGTTENDQRRIDGRPKASDAGDSPMTDDLFSHSLFGDVAPHIVDKFLPYHRENPEVYAAFKRFAYELKQAGRDHFGSKGIMERLRWWSAVEAKNDQFKINNSYASCYARLLVFEDPGFSDFFQLRSTARRAA